MLTKYEWIPKLLILKNFTAHEYSNKFGKFKMAWLMPEGLTELLESKRIALNCRRITLFIWLEPAPPHDVIAYDKRDCHKHCEK